MHISNPNIWAEVCLKSNETRYAVWACGVCGWRSRAKGKAVLPFDIWLHILVILFYPPRWLVDVMPWPKTPKRIIQKKRQQQIRDENVSFILSFIYWVQQPFHGWGSFSRIHWNDWIPQLRCQKYVNHFHASIYPHLVFRASIRVSFLLEVCQSSVRVSL